MAPKERLVVEKIRAPRIEQARPRLARLRLNKKDEKKMPVFSRDIPASSKRTDNEDTVTIAYKWKMQESASELDSIKVGSIVFRNTEGFENFSKINIRDGQDRIWIKYNDVTYFLRKTSEDIARALYNAASMIRGSIENIVGYIRTVFGNTYVISSIERGSWTFDEKLECEQVQLADPSQFNQAHKERLVELVTERLASLHKQKIMLGKFGLKNILITAKNLIFTDLRCMRFGRKSRLFVGEFISTMRYLLATGMARHNDISHAAMVYAVEMSYACNQWYRHETGTGTGDEMELIERIELKINEETGTENALLY